MRPRDGSGDVRSRIRRRSTKLSARSGIGGFLERRRRSRPLLLRGGRLEGRRVDLRIQGDRIVAIGPRLEAVAGEAVLPLDGELLLPGLVNAHDHLQLDVCPRSGRPPYPDAHAWAADIDAGRGAGLQPHVALPIDDRCRWGALRNLLAGVTWVGHHDPRYPACDRPDFPVRLPTRYAFIDSVRSGHIASARRRAGRGVFFVHLGEGTAPSSREELATLEREGGLGPATVAVHGTALTASDRAQLEAAKAALVACPSSNRFLLGAHGSIAGLTRWALGTDSTLTGSDHLLDEVRVAREALACSPEELLAAVTHRGAAVLRLPLGAGRLEVGAPACVVAARTDLTDPAEALLELRPRDIAAVVNGTLRAAHPELRGVELEGAIRVDGERRRVGRTDADTVSRVCGRVEAVAPSWIRPER